jgi:D-alanyl-D-alanine carboxypeptidase
MLCDGLKPLELTVTQTVARLLLPAIAVELRNEGKFLTSDDAIALRLLMKEIDYQLRVL